MITSEAKRVADSVAYCESCWLFEASCVRKIEKCSLFNCFVIWGVYWQEVCKVIPI